MEGLVTIIDPRADAAFQLEPHSIEAEQSFLGSLLKIGGELFCIMEDLDILSPHVLYRPEHRSIFKAIVQVYKHKKAIDIISVSDELRSRKELEACGDMVYLNELYHNTYAPNHIKTYIEIIKEKFILREILSTCNDISKKVINLKGRCSTDILEEAEKRISDIAQRHLRGHGCSENVQSIAKRSLGIIDDRVKNSGNVSGLSTGFKDLDDLTTGLHKGELIILAARPSMGKTALAMNIAEHNALQSGRMVLVYSMEMSKDELLIRMYSSLGRINQKRLRTGALTDEHMARLAQTNEMIQNVRMEIDDTGGLTPTELRARAKKMAREHDVGLIVVDYLQMMTVPGLEFNRTAAITEISRSLKCLAKELNIPVIALSQLNRSFEGRQDKRPILSDLRESGAIEQDADLVAFVYRDEMHDSNSSDKGIAEIIVGKHRNGELGTVLLTFVGHHTRFENFAGKTSRRTDL